MTKKEVKKVVGGIDNELLDIPEQLPMVPVRDMVVFPYMIVPLFIGRESSVNAIDEALAGQRLVFISTQKDAKVEDPKIDQIFETGTICMIMRMRKLSDGRVKVLVQGLIKAKIQKCHKEKPFFLVSVERAKDETVEKVSLEAEALMRSTKEAIEQIVSMGKVLSPDILMVLEDISDPGRLADLIASNVGLKVEDSQKVLEIEDPLERLRFVDERLHKELDLLKMKIQIENRAKEEMGKMQKEYFLREQMRAIKSELGDMDPKAEEAAEFKKKILEAKMPKENEEEALKQLSRFEQMPSEAAEATIVRTYLDWLSEVPWSKETKDSLNIHNARQVLDEDHYGLEKVKERILEYLGVRKLTKTIKGPILCFLGPPGVGKTSLGKSIARAMGRKFIRISLGGVHDEAEIRGHRRTYIGAMPGKIIQSIKQAGSNNPVFMMDEIDKIGSTYRGDPSSALLEVLDPEQNNAFRDHYLNMPFDLSRVMFITTANLIDPIPSALKDRMEIIKLSGYSEEEKTEIAKQFLVLKQRKENGLTEKDLIIPDNTIRHIIRHYTREAGLRNLEREIAKICRKVAKMIAESLDEKAEPFKPPVTVEIQKLKEFLGPQLVPHDDKREENEIGVATGLAWTEFGGEVLTVEASMVKGKGVLTLTGHLGDVMKESAQAALTYARAKALEFGIEKNFFDDQEIHVHVPAGAIPKDGPSAGITMAAAIASRLTNIPVDREIAMTGEVTLTGRVLPVGGIKEKILAAIRSDLTKIIMPAKSEKDLEEIPAHIRKKIEVITVSTMDEVLDAALIGWAGKIRKRRGGKTSPRLTKRAINNQKISTTNKKNLIAAKKRLKGIQQPQKERRARKSTSVRTSVSPRAVAP